MAILGAEHSKRCLKYQPATSREVLCPYDQLRECWTTSAMHDSMQRASRILTAGTWTKDEGCIISQYYERYSWASAMFKALQGKDVS